MGFIILFLLILLLLSPGIYFAWRDRNDGKFDIRESDGKFDLWYCHRDEWMLDSVHNTRELAIAKIKFFTLHQSGRKIRRGFWSQ